MVSTGLWDIKCKKQTRTEKFLSQYQDRGPWLKYANSLWPQFTIYNRKIIPVSPKTWHDNLNMFQQLCHEMSYCLFGGIFIVCAPQSKKERKKGSFSVRKVWSKWLTETIYLCHNSTQLSCKWSSKHRLNEIDCFSANKLLWWISITISSEITTNVFEGNCISASRNIMLLCLNLWL